jgi:uncharacterized protein (DUF488 family)
MTQIYTIGYEGTDIERFVRTLKIVGVEQLVDVRAVPLSRKKGFSKNRLRDRVEAEGIRYVHLSPLGDPKDGREAAKAGRFDQFRRIYSKHLSGAVAQECLTTLANLIVEKSTCLMCFERDPAECHRSIVASELKAVETLHLFADEPNRYVRNASKLPGRRSYQGASAAQ